MKIVTLKAPLAWSIFNEGVTSFRLWSGKVDIPVEVLIHASSKTNDEDVKDFTKEYGVVVPALNRIPLGEVLGFVTVIESVRVPTAWYDWKINNITEIKRFEWFGQSGVHDYDGEEIDLNSSKNPVFQWCGNKYSYPKVINYKIRIWKNEYNKFSFCVSSKVPNNPYFENKPRYGEFDSPYMAQEEAVNNIHLYAYKEDAFKQIIAANKKNFEQKLN